MKTLHEASLSKRGSKKLGNGLLNEYERTELNGYAGIELNKYFW